MSIILRHEIECGAEDCIVIIHIDPDTPEFSKDFDSCDSSEPQSLMGFIQQYVHCQFPNLKIRLVKIMIGSVVVATVTLSRTPAAHAAASTINSQTSYVNYTVASGDSLWAISNKFHVSISDIKTANSLTTDTLYVGQVLKIPQNVTETTPQTSYTTYKVVSGDSLYIIAKRFNTTVPTIKSLNNLTTETIYIGQTLKIPTVAATTPAPGTTNYTVVSGDTLWLISKKFNTTVDDLRRLNYLTSDALYIGQILKVPAGTVTPPPATTPPITPTPVIQPPIENQQPTVTYITHTVAAGDNPWNLSIKYGVPMTELLNVNGFTQSTVLQIGQEVKIPVHNVPVKPTPGPQYGERLDWWTEAQYVFPINKTAKITDFATGRTFTIKRTIGANHADCEPLTAADAAIMKEVWGGAYSWTARAVIVEVDGRRIAGSIASMPHDIEYILDNDFTGHFDLHFLNSTRHKDGLIDPYHQTQIDIASGYSQK